MLTRYTDALAREFRRTNDKHEAHARIRPILEDMAAADVLSAVFERHLRQPGALNARHYPVISCDIVHEARFGLVANCWIPLPDGNIDLSTKAIHHHGEMLLTTVTAFGPGYEHWTFTTPELRDGPRELYTMRLIERAPHPRGHCAFVDSYMAHVPFYPPDVTVTLALWSSRRRTTWKDRLKRVPLLHKHSTTLRRLGAALGFTRALDLKVAKYFDFTPTAFGFRGIEEREEFPRGPNADYLSSLFHVIQRTGCETVAPEIERRLKEGGVQNAALIRTLLDDLRKGRPIEGRLSEGHYGVALANFTGRQIEEALGAVAVLHQAV